MGPLGLASNVWRAASVADWPGPLNGETRLHGPQTKRGVALVQSRKSRDVALDWREVCNDLGWDLAI